MHSLKRDLLLKNAFNQSVFDLTLKPVCFLKTDLNRGIQSKADLIQAGYFLELVGAQKPTSIRAKKPSATFKNRKNELLGWKTTLRKRNFIQFMQKVHFFVYAQESTDYKISNLSSIIEFQDFLKPIDLVIHYKRTQ